MRLEDLDPKVRARVQAQYDRAVERLDGVSAPPAAADKVIGAAAGSAPTGRMNKTEARYAAFLDQLPAVRYYKYEALKLRIGHDCWYTPDFMVVLSDGTVEMHEVKGPYIRDKALTKPKAAATLFPMWRWRLAQWQGPSRDEGGWHLRNLDGRG